MKKVIRWLLLLAAGLLFAVWAGGYVKEKQRLLWVEQMGPGINLGNALDVKGLREQKPEATVADFETYWGNPQVTKKAIQSIKEEGFHSVRIPVSWEEHLDENGIIDPLWMARVEEVVGWAIEADLYTILNTHHESWIVPTKEKEEEVREKLCFVWKQIAETFADCDGHLMFEGMNEPRLEDSEYEWTEGTEEMRQVVNRLNAAFVETVRESGGENAERWLIITDYAGRYERQAMKAVEVPEDEHIIVAVHAYLPYEFTLAEEGSESWDVNDTEDTEKIDALMEDLDELFLKKGVPVMITEFGCREKADEAERLEWAEYYTEAAAEKGIPLIWWNNGKESKLLDRVTGEWRYQQLVDILTGKS